MLHTGTLPAPIPLVEPALVTNAMQQIMLLCIIYYNSNII